MIDRTDTSRTILALAGLAGAAGVALAAEGFHRSDLDLSIAGSFLLLHAPALIGIALLKANRVSQLAGCVLVFGLIVFAGDLSVHARLGHGLFPLAAPIGGGALMLGWLLLALSALAGWRRRGGDV